MIQFSSQNEMRSNPLFGLADLMCYRETMGKKSLVFIVAVAAVLFFQNCGKAGFDSQGGLDQGSNSALSTDPKIVGSPFPYEASANVISYMSCPTGETSPNKDAYYNFKLMGAETTSFNTIVSALSRVNLNTLAPMGEGGVRLTPEYVAYMDKNFKGLKSNATSEQIQAALQAHPEYKDARLQISFRKVADIKGTLLNHPGSSTPAAEWIIDKLSSPLNAKLISDSRDKWVNTFPRTTLEPATISSAMAFSAPSEKDMENFRAQLSRDFYLTMAFIKNDKTSGNALQFVGYPAGTDGIYGRGYALQFSNPPKPAAVTTASYNTTTGIPKPRAAILSSTGIFEYDLATGSPVSATWNCLSYGIVRYQDKNLCPVEEYSRINRDQLEVIRKVLRAEDWQVNTTMGCIVPTQSNSAFSCYNAGTAANPANERALWAGNTMLNFTGGPRGFGYPYPDPAGALTTGIEYRYWTKNCSSTFRECVNFANFCYKKK
jgi:hypothetical protein